MSAGFYFKHLPDLICAPVIPLIYLFDFQGNFLISLTLRWFQKAAPIFAQHDAKWEFKKGSRSERVMMLILSRKRTRGVSRADDPYDNAWAESFWTGPPGGRMKAETDMPKGGYESIEKLRSVLFDRGGGPLH
jgi:hypothetical protein